jgi:hypothetical protein
MKQESEPIMAALEIILPLEKESADFQVGEGNCG